MEHPNSDSRRDAFRTLPFGWVVGGLSVAVAAFHLLTIQEHVGWHGDSYQYLLHARNILEGRPYAATGYIQNPDYYLAPIAYPAGFPLLLVPVLALFGTNAYAIAALLTGVWVAAVAALAVLLREDMPPPYIYALVLVVGLQPYFWSLKHDPLSDLPFLLASFLSLLWYERAVRSAGRRYAGSAALSGLAAAFAIGTRPLAIVLLPSLLVYDLVRARRPTRSFVIAAAACGVAYGLYAVFVDLGAGGQIAQLDGASGDVPTVGDGGYGTLVYIAILEKVGDIPGHVLARLADYARASFVFWHVPVAGGSIIKNGLMALSLLPVAVGLGYRLRHCFRSVDAFALLYGLSLLPWSFGDVRYLVPLIVLYYVYLFTGLDRLRSWNANVGRMSTVVVGVALVVVFALQYGDMKRVGTQRVSVQERAADPAFVYLREETPPSAIVMTSGDPRAMVFHTGREGVVGPRRPQRWQAFAEQIGSRYVLVGSKESERAAPYLDRSHLIVSSERWDLYLLPSAQALGGGEAERAP